MILSIFFLFCIWSIIRDFSPQRILLCFAAFVVYVGYDCYDLCWLLNNTHWPFHPSDPSAYYKDVIGKNFNQIISVESSNTFYYIVNWINWNIWENATFCSLMLRLNNILAYLICYLLATDRNRPISVIDLLLLFNPFAIITIARNVRDIYIILFVLITMRGIGIFPKIHSNKILSICGFFLLIITRAIMILPISLDWYYNIRNHISRKSKMLMMTLCGLLILLFFPYILHTVANQMISAIQYVGEDIEPYLPLLNGQMPFSTIKSVIYRLFIGSISIIFTPHPLNFLSEWMESPDFYSIVGIYTFPDNCLIFIGSIFNYLFIIPLVFFAIIKFKRLNKGLLIFTLSFIVLYVVSYLGVVDIRNRNTMFFFILITLYYSNIRISIPVKCYFATIIVFSGIYLLSA